MASYDSILLCNAAAKILRYSAPGTNTKVAIECAGFQKLNKEYDNYRKRIERQQNRLITSIPDVVIVVPGESKVSTATLSLLSDTEACSSVVYFVDVSMRRIPTFFLSSLQISTEKRPIKRRRSNKGMGPNYRQEMQRRCEEGKKRRRHLQLPLNNDI